MPSLDISQIRTVVLLIVWDALGTSVHAFTIYSYAFLSSYSPTADPLAAVVPFFPAFLFLVLKS